MMVQKLPNLQQVPKNKAHETVMNKLVVETANRCKVWHRWKLVEDNGKTLYCECVDCGSRLEVQREGGHQPMNYAWLVQRTDDV